MSFNFGTSAASGTSSTPAPAFGSGNTTSGSTGGFTFGKPTTPATPAAGSGSGLFGSAASSGGGLFGGSATSGTSSTPSTSAPASGGLFGATASTTPAASSGAGLFGAGAKADTTTTSAPATGGLFGASSTPAFSAPAATGNIFGGATSGTSTTSTTTPTPIFGAGAVKPAGLGGLGTGLATPAKPGFFGTNSTTPAGAPPTTKPSGPSSLGLSSTTASATPTTAPTTSIFGAAAASTTPATSAPPASGGLFGAKPAAAPATGNFFGNKTAEATTTNTSTGTTATTTATSAPTTTATPSLFGSKSAGSTPATTAAAATSAATTTTAAGGLFGAKPTENATTTSTIAPSKPALSFGSLGTTTPATTSTPSTAATTTTAAAPAKPMFGAPATTTPATSSATTATNPTTTTTSNALGASTVGPASQLPRLKNKSMDDIITRWASDLTKYQKDFKDQATKVADWDRLLVDNGEKIQKLYLNTFEAERASNEIEKQLMAVESQQDELEAWLDKYEGEVKEMVSRQYGANDQLGGPDQERERTYKLAEKLSQTLDEKSHDLGKMVDEINEISSTLSKSSRPEDPVSQIVRVLNGHLSQLQWIDTNAAALQAKIAATQKAGGNLGSQYGMSDNDAAESFYRSYMPRK
ncbi:Nucleoporin nsp1 [Ceratocystis platani]|uniref:Nucleoporin NSP1 n=1 Tax=Ceratocystis fimbriata f. sp. platani TaxID=88771 RepID=A0A0F8DD09_CERFI|nr:Nucleoporin nsp1 [Ceratocystis platani]